MITSVHNQLIKDIKKLYTKKGRKKQNAYLLDGWHLVQEAIVAGSSFIHVLATKKAYDQYQSALAALDVILISEEIAQSISQTKTPQGIFATVAIPETNELDPSDAVTAKHSWLLLDGVQDPGNIGTMVRTADACGMDGVIFGQGCADMYHPKVIRAMQGSQFHLKLASGNLAAWVAGLKQNDVPVFGSELNEAAKDYRTVGQFEHFGLIMGNEGAGMQQSLLEATTKNLYIPIKGKAESLNVGVAAGVLMFALHK